MKLIQPISLSEAARILDCTFIGDPDHQITGFNEIHRVEAGDTTFVDVEKYYKKALGSAATTVIINKEVEPPAGKGLLISDDPFRDYNRLTRQFQPRMPLDLAGEPQMGKDVRIGRNVAFGENVTLADGVEIGHNAVIGSNVSIGEGTLIYPNVTVYDHSVIGAHCVIGSGTVIGGEAFYFKGRANSRDKLLSVGRAVIQDHVEIGANCTIDRGVSADTIIGAHTKLDNLVQVGHDTEIGKMCLLASQVGVAGCVQIGDGAILWGQVGVNKDLSIGSGAVLLGKTGVMSDLEGKRAYGGMVADDARTFLKKEAIFKQLPELMPKLLKMIEEYEKGV